MVKFATCWRDEELEFIMARQWFADLSIAVLLALPLAFFVWSQPIAYQQVSSPSVKASTANHAPGNAGRISLLG